MDSLRYYPLGRFLKERFGEKVYKISLDAGFSCPNRDGTLSNSGCIFCSSSGSGDFAGNPEKSIKEQLLYSPKGTLELSEKYDINKFIAYFQAHTNTYANINALREKYYEALSVPGVVGIAIATRPDCLGEEVLQLLDEINQKTFLWIELGLQTIHEKTAELINRGYPLKVFEASLEKLDKLGINTVCHLIFGLPGENREDMLDSVRYISKRTLHGVKIHLLHVLEGTHLAAMYRNKEFDTLTKEQYVSLAVDALELLPPDMVIHRITGDGPKDTLIAPTWSRYKRNVLDSIQKELNLRNSWQGKLFRV